MIAQWNEKAAAVSQTADELRAAGIAAEADRFDDLARIALERQLTAESDVRSVQHTMDAQLESVGRLSNGLGQMRAKLSELRHKRDDLDARSGSGREHRPAAAGLREHRHPGSGQRCRALR